MKLVDPTAFLILAAGRQRCGAVCEVRAGTKGQRSLTYAVKRRTKIAISVVYYIILEANRLVNRVAGRRYSCRLVILYYHGVPANSNFPRQLDIISRYSKPVPIDYRQAGPLGGHCVALTFDDAFESVLHNAVPELLARHIPATIFLNKERVSSWP